MVFRPGNLGSAAQTNSFCAPLVASSVTGWRRPASVKRTCAGVSSTAVGPEGSKVIGSTSSMGVPA